MKAVEDGWTTVGIQAKDGVVLAAEKKIQNRLQIPSSIEKIMKIDDNVICTYSGLLSDARALLESARVEAANHWFTFNEKMPVESISLAICEMALSFADKDSKKDKDKKDDKNKDKKDGEGNNKKDKPQPKPSQGGISKQRLENLLDAVNNEEKKIQDKVNAKKVKGKPVQTEKDW